MALLYRNKITNLFLPLIFLSRFFIPVSSTHGAHLACLCHLSSSCTSKGCPLDWAVSAVLSILYANYPFNPNVPSLIETKVVKLNIEVNKLN